MAAEYSVEVCRILEQRFNDAKLHRPMRIRRYDAGQELFYKVMAIENANEGRAHLVVDRFVGGGFAGQVYQVRVLDIEQPDGPIGGLRIGGVYALKILVPPSKFSEIFRNFLYGLGFQGPFQLQVNPAAARAGALWQKFIRRGAKIRFGDESSIADIHATFVDEKIGSCGELSEWVEGRTWRLEVDDRMDLLRSWARGGATDQRQPGSPEYRAKRKFMAELVEMLHDMGADELARQYEWLTCKSQPNCLKRSGTEDNAAKGLAAIDFRAGLVLLPFLPMSPGDFKLILDGMGRGSLVQFDRGDMVKLEMFVKEHYEQFADMRTMLDELKQMERICRYSIPDITHNHARLLYDARLWSTIFDSTVTGWRVRNLVDQKWDWRLRINRFFAFLFFLLGLIPFLGNLLRRIWCRGDWRQHYCEMLTSWDYLKRTARARMAEKVMSWHRAGRVDEKRALLLSQSLFRFLCHLPFLILPAGLHRFFTDWKYAKERSAFYIVRPVRLYFNAQLREQWLLEMVSEGQKKHMLSNEDAGVILSQIKEPFIQKYLKCLAVHLSTLFVTEAVAVTFAIGYVLTHPDMPWTHAWGRAIGIIALFQVLPVSPGSLVRGFYVLYLVIKERNFKDYNIALVWGFFRYIGYLAFPIQMTYRYPALARFMAGHWATEAVHIVPVFGERGALLEHWVFGLFYNWPLTIRRRIRKRAEIRAAMKPRYWHAAACAIAGAIILGAVDLVYLKNTGTLPTLKTIWYLAIILPLTCGAVVTAGAGGLILSKRIVIATICGAAMGVFHTAILLILGSGIEITVAKIVTGCLWRAFVFALFSTIGAVVTELKLPEPRSGDSAGVVF